MNIIEVSKKENIGKAYEIFLEGVNRGKWRIEEVGVDDFDFYNEEEEQLGEVYFVSQIVKMEFKETIDQSKVSVDTPIWVRDDEDVDWLPRHFAKYEGGKVLAWDGGKTSFTATGEGETTSWDYVKLHQE